MPTESALGLCVAGIWFWSAGWHMAGERLVLSLVWTSCFVFGNCRMPPKIGVINLSMVEYTLVSEVHKE